MKIGFYGAVDGVTGSCHMISTEKHKVLMDCGMFQGNKEEEAKNRLDFPFNPAEIDAVLISHAHIDHCGRLPLLIKRGFKGPIYATDATADLLSVMLQDAAHIHEQEAITQNRKNERAGKPLVEALYTAQDALDTIDHIQGIPYDTLLHVTEDIDAVFNDAGHILGSAIIEVWAKEGDRRPKIVFSGDLGMPDRPILKDPKHIKNADVLIMESTYGNRLHEPNPTSVDRLYKIIAETCPKGGNVVIPSFAVGRTQEIIYELNKVYDGHTPYTEMFKNIPVYVDSPMSVKATEIFRLNADTYDEDARDYIMKGDRPLDFKGLHYASTSEESKQINVDTTPKIIISASGMCDAGRIRHHLKHNLWRPECAIVFVGYQAEGSLGKYILDGAESVKLFGEEIVCRAKIYNLGGFSGHADRDGLMNWIDGFMKKPKHVFLVHGEKESKEALSQYISDKKKWNATVVSGYEEYEI